MKPTKFRHKSRLWEVNSAVPCVGQGFLCKSIFEGKIMQPCGCSCLLLNHVLVVSDGSLETQDYEGIGQEGIMVCRNLGSRERFSASLIFSTPEDLTWPNRRCGDTTGFFVLLDHWTPSTPIKISIICTMFTSTIYIHGFILGIWWWNIRFHVTSSGQTTQRLFNEPSPIVTSRLPPKIGNIMDFQESLQSLLQNFHQKDMLYLTNPVFHQKAWFSTGVFNPSNLWPEIRTSGLTGLRLCSLFWRIGCTRPRCASWIVQVFRNWGGWMRSCIWWLGFQKRYEKRKMWWKIMIDFFQAVN